MVHITIDAIVIADRGSPLREPGKEGKLDKTKIDWCDSTWNPVTGCLHGCEYCYARGYTRRFGKNLPDLSDFASRNKGMHLLDNRIDFAPYPYGFEPTFHAYRLNDYMGKKGRNIFVCSMADLFGKWVPDRWIIDVMNVCIKNPDNNYLFLTKNPGRYKEYYIPRDFATLWFGTTVTGKSEISRVYEMAGLRNKFVSVEPLLEDLELRRFSRFFLCVDWVIIGSETGRRKNKVAPERKWIEDIVNECRKANIPVFMKSSLAEIWGEPFIQEFPEGLQRRKQSK